MIMTVHRCTIVACTAYLMDYQNDTYFCYKDSSGTQNLKIRITNEFEEKRGGGEGRNSFANIHIYLSIKLAVPSFADRKINFLD
jgi:hypothetical protein